MACIAQIPAMAVCAICVICSSFGSSYRRALSKGDLKDKKMQKAFIVTSITAAVIAIVGFIVGKAVGFAPFPFSLLACPSGMSNNG